MAVTIYIKAGAFAGGTTKIKIKEGARVKVSDSSEGLISIYHANGSLIGVASATNVVGVVADGPGSAPSVSEAE